MVFATGGYSGKIRVAPGTFGTVAGLPFIFILSRIPAPYNIIYVIGLILAAMYVSDQAEKILNKKDPGCIVIDEIAGYVVTMSLVPLGIAALVAGFLMFRFFDIVKPAPVKYFERNFSGGAGIVLDDVMAGILSAVGLRILYLLDIF